MTSTHTYPTFRDIWGLMDHVTGAGNYFFSPGALSFFNARVHGDLYGGRFFVTSERCDWGDGHPRYYTVRFVRDNGDGSVAVTSTGFQRFASRSGAHAHAASLAQLIANGTDPLTFDGDRAYVTTETATESDDV